MYTDKELAFDRAKQLAGIDTLDFAKDDYINELLELSAGSVTDSSEAGVEVITTHYRPFITAARLLEQDLDIQFLSEADRAKFTGQAVPIASLLQMQASYDAKYGLAVPDGFAAVISEPLPVMSIFTS